MSMVLAQMWDRDGGHMDGGWWWVMGIGWLVFLAAIVVIVVVLVRRSDHRGTTAARSGTGRVAGGASRSAERSTRASTGVVSDALRS